MHLKRFSLTYRHRANGNLGHVMMLHGFTKHRILGLPGGHHAVKHKSLPFHLVIIYKAYQYKRGINDVRLSLLTMTNPN